MKALVLNDVSEAKRIYGSVFEGTDIQPVFVPDKRIGASTILDQIAPDIVLLSLEWRSFQRIISFESKKRGIPVLYVMDGVLEWSYLWKNQTFVQPAGTVLQPLIADAISVIGRHPARILAALGLGPRIHVVGLPRLDDYSRAKIVNSGATPTILVCCARTPSHNSDQLLHVVSAISDLRDVIARLGLKSLWRIGDDLGREFGLIPDNGDLNDTLSRVDAVITFPSTLALESMLKGIPTAIIDYRAVPIYLDTAWQIRCRAHIETVLNALLYPSPEGRAHQDFCLDEELAFGGATERLRRLIYALSDPTRSRERELSLPAYGAIDYRLVHPQISCFSTTDSAMLRYATEAYMRRDRDLKDWSERFKAVWVVRLVRKLRRFPLFRKFNRLLDEV